MRSPRSAAFSSEIHLARACPTHAWMVIHMPMASLQVLTPSSIGSVEIRNRFIRSSTSETLADEDGFITPRYRALHQALARGGVGLIFTGHCYVHPSGKSIAGMTQMHDDDHIPQLRRLTDAVHAEGARIFAQLQHAGSQSRAPEVVPVAPSVVPNPQFGRTPTEATPAQIAEIIAAFGEAAGRVNAAGFDGVHVHAGHGYLISEFLSPASNLRRDEWGGSLENRQRFGLETYRAMRAEVGPDFPITWKLGLQDFVPGGLTLDEGLATADRFAAEGVDAIEGSAGLMSPKAESAPMYVAVDTRRAFEDRLFHRMFKPPVAQAYFRDWARALRRRLDCRVILVGGLRTTEVMEAAIADGDADFVSLARPFIREPDLVRKIEAGKRGLVECVSCNICLDHEGTHGLKCWRQSNRDLATHAWLRATGKLH
jgi:2,4-dienoyl-CoA reductase-like NADH-dependent reductase (Old Yellow Enzyme family)